jgi:hypothetical protein
MSLRKGDFEKKYRKKQYFSSDYATRGFDMTFDTMMRLVQNKSFEETVNSAATQQVENKLNTTKKKTVVHKIKAFYNVFRYRFDY